MRHVDPDLLAELALGEPASEKVAAHIASCEQCSAELDALGQVVSTGRELNESEVLVEPPPHVWDEVARATGIDPLDLDRAAELEDRSRGADASSTMPSNGPPTMPPTGLPSGSSKGSAGPRWALAAALAGLLAGIGGVVGWQALSDGDDGGDPPASVVAQAALDPVAESAASGQAELVTVDGERRLEIDVADVASTDGYLEVWLLAPDVSGMVSLGTLPGSATSLVIPDGLDISAFPVVDVSVEPFDGDPAHSGNSVVRGELQDEQ